MSTYGGSMTIPGDVTNDGGPMSRTSTAIRFPPELHARLVEEAGARGVPLNWLVCRLLTESLERLVPADEMRLTKR